jgi:4-alpha-glucanotransferase
LQDVLGLGRDARMNVPGSPSGNWRWRLRPELLNGDALDRLAALTEIFGRRVPAGRGR